MRFGSVDYEKKEGIVVMTLDDQPKLNALSSGIVSGLRQGFDEMDGDDEVQIAIVTGKGRSFCAGADITGIDPTPANMKRYMKEIFMTALCRAEKLIKPVIAAVNGLALGGGLELAISCDIIIASDKAQFGVPEARLGLVPGFAIVRLDQLIGRNKAKELTMTTDPISAEEAFRINLANKVVPHDKLMDEAIAMAKRIMAQGPLAVQFAKSAYNRHLWGEDLAYATDAMAMLFGTEDAKEGTTAFLEKRKPVFKGR